MMVDKEGLNIRSLSVSMKAEGAENDFKHSITVTKNIYKYNNTNNQKKYENEHV